MRLTVVLAWASCCLTLTSAWSDSYSAWAADLQPGWMIQSHKVGGKICHCKVPSNETTTVAATTAAPSTTAPTTAAPNTAAPTTAAPSTAAPTTAAPSTAAPTTAAPSTAAPTTAAPSTAAPTTAAPSTATPTTAAPITAAPTTAAPTTAAPTTAAPTTAAPTTAAPTTAAPTTAAPTTAAPTTAAPTTAAPTTAAPTTVDVGACTMDVTVTAATDLYWTSPGFPSNYPDDITCTLTVTIPADLPMGLVTVTPMAGSAIYTTPGCSSDKMTYTSSMGATAISCGSNLDEVSEGAVFDGPKTFTLTFTSSSSDGGKTSSGFRYHIRGFDLMGK